MLLKKLFRTAWKYKAQFISMIIMISIGAGVFMGFNMEWYSLEKDVTDFLDATKYADYRIYDEAGFTEENIKNIPYASNEIISIIENETSLSKITDIVAPTLYGYTKETIENALTAIKEAEDAINSLEVAKGGEG